MMKKAMILPKIPINRALKSLVPGRMAEKMEFEPLFLLETSVEACVLDREMTMEDEHAPAR
jgi:hypothetical protein